MQLATDCSLSPTHACGKKEATRGKAGRASGGIDSFIYGCGVAICGSALSGG